LILKYGVGADNMNIDIHPELVPETTLLKSNHILPPLSQKLLKPF
jgi:hypothetical protein